MCIYVYIYAYHYISNYIYNQLLVHSTTMDIGPKNIKMEPENHGVTKEFPLAALASLNTVAGDPVFSPLNYLV